MLEPGGPKPPVRPPTDSPLGGTPGSEPPVGPPIQPPSAGLEADLIDELDLQGSNGLGLDIGGGVIFEYTFGSATNTLHLRLDPYEVDWTYNVITNVVDTYGGQVVQVLGINIGVLTIKGRFGKETPWGAIVRDNERIPLGEIKNGVSDIWDWQANSGKYAIGLTQMTTYFREYFALNTQGQDATVPNGHFVQIPMTLKYPNRSWRITPFSFPSYRRSNKDFAPEWMVQAYVVEKADNDNIPPTKPPTLDSIHLADMAHALERINSIIGYPEKDANPWSDPFPGNKKPNLAEAEKVALKMVHMYKDMLPPYTEGDIKKMLWQDISTPTAYDYGGVDTGSTSNDQPDQPDGVPNNSGDPGGVGK